MIMSLVKSFNIVVNFMISLSINVDDVTVNVDDEVTVMVTFIFMISPSVNIDDEDTVTCCSKFYDFTFGNMLIMRSLLLLMMMSQSIPQ